MIKIFVKKLLFAVEFGEEKTYNTADRCGRAAGYGTGRWYYTYLQCKMGKEKTE